MEIKLSELSENELLVVKEIYDYYILNSTATFHTEPISVNELKEAIYLSHPKYKSYLILNEGQIAGYCYFAPYKKRQAYDRSAEITLYLKPELTSKGIGREVLTLLEPVAKLSGIVVLLAIVTGENTSSIALFEKCGYEKCAHFKNVGEKFNRLLDVVALQKMLD